MKERVASVKAFAFRGNPQEEEEEEEDAGATSPNLYPHTFVQLLMSTDSHSRTFVGYFGLTPLLAYPCATARRFMYSLMLTA